MGVAVNQLRGPDIFQDEDGQLYLLYTGAGEQGIGIATLTVDNKWLKGIGYLRGLLNVQKSKFNPEASGANHRS